ncbi:hypothetical protein [Pseudonocardia sp.]|uniref:hypothetical protein n=1 Tax=Pseudonocardia sp. TaxID=60912 RepID=UPI00262F15DF|nr:hypothetical protein [Pseudonocardia sp.]
MWFPYGTGRWAWMRHEEAAGAPAEEPGPPGPGRPDGAVPTPFDEDTTVVTGWEAAAILLGLAALSGSVTVVVLSVCAAAAVWLMVTAADQAPPPAGRSRRPR